MGGLVRTVEPDSAAERAGLLAGDVVLAVNGHRLRDVIDAQFYGAEGELWIEWERGGEARSARARRDPGQALGIVFDHPTFDIDIRRCNNLCPFCFVLQNAPRMRRTLYIKDDDYRYSFLFGHFVTLTNLGDQDWARLAEQRLSPLYVSVHATDPEIRQRCLRNPAAPDVMEQLRWLARHGIETHTQLVITPGLNDGACAERSVFDLAELYPRVQSVSVVPVGLTRHHKYGHRTHTRDEAGAMLDAVQAWQQVFVSRFGARFVHATDEWYLLAGRALPAKRAYEGLALQENGLGMVRDFLDEWRRLKRTELRGLAASRGHPSPAFRHRSVTLVTARLFAPTLNRAAAELARLTGVAVEVIAVDNRRLGETITVAGLLMGRDVIERLAQQDGNQAAEGSLVVLPRIMFDHPDGVALDDVAPVEIARAIKRPVALADWMGDVLDALTGRNRLAYSPDEPEAGAPVMREGGWSLEKYL